ncbi:MAG: TonB-dependent receptor, partial [Ferruginibacter sp.]
PGMSSRGRFNPFLFKGTIFSTGGYSALYGQALSSALILESTDLPDKTEGNFSASVIGIGGGIQKLSKNKKSSWGATYYYTNLELAFKAMKQENDYFFVPKNNTVDANFRIKTKRGFIKYYGYGSFDKVGFRAADIDSAKLKNAFSLKNGNTYQNINWREFIGSGWKMQLALSYSYNQDNIHNELQDEDDKTQIITTPELYAFKKFSIIAKSNYAQARLVIEKKGKGLNAFRFGADEFYSKENTNYTSFDSAKYLKNVIDYLTAIFAEKDFYVTNDLAIKFGLRAEHSYILKKWNLAERLSLAYKFKDNSQASFAFGTFYQNPESKYLPGFDELGYSKATHYILQYQKFSSKKTFRTELFYKKYNNLYKTSPGFTGTVAKNNEGFGYAKGLEIFWRDKSSIKNFDYWISYSFLDTKRDYLNFPFEMTPSFAAKHTASLVMKKFVLPWKTGFNASYTYASGRPYYDLSYSQTDNKYVVKDRGKTIDYNSLNFSLNYLPNLGKKDAKTFGIWVLSISNILGNKQVYGYNYSSDSRNKVAIIPPSKSFVYIGYFLSFGIDRTEDAINNNL